LLNFPTSFSFLAKSTPFLSSTAEMPEPDGEKEYCHGSLDRGSNPSDDLNPEINSSASDIASVTQCDRADSPPIASEGPS
jgi:hypothetical protein